MATLLVIRAADLVLLGLESTGCTLEPGLLRATEPGATLTVTFPPQSMAEGKTPGAFIPGALLSRSSTIGYVLDPGTEVPLDVEGLLRALLSLPITPEGAALEMPYGLQLGVAGADGGAVTPTAPVHPIEAGGTHGLWQLVVHDLLVGRPGVVRPTRALPVDEPGDSHPLSSQDRGTIVESQAAATSGKLRLSALGGTLDAHLVAGGTRWDHDLALGRDQHVRFEQAGLLYPFGHAATRVETVDRVVEGGAARLHRETRLLIHDPVRRFPDDGSREAREFPFTEVEMLTTSYAGVSTAPMDPPRTFTRPPDVTEPMVARRQQIADVELPAAFQVFSDVYDHIPREIFQLEGNFFDTQQAADLRAAWARLGDAEAELKAIEEELASRGGTEPPGGGTEPPGGGTEPPVFLGPDGLPGDAPSRPEAPFEPPAADVAPGALVAAAAKVAQAKADVNSLTPAVQAFVDGLQVLQATPEEQADRNLYVKRLGEVLQRGEALEILRLTAELDALAAILDSAPAPTVSRLVFTDNLVDVPFIVRCAGRLGDVTMSMPMLFLHDLVVPPDSFFGGFDNLLDPNLVTGLPAPTSPLPGTSVDLVRRAGEPATIDVQELHSVTISAEKTEVGIRPVLQGFTMEVPELRSLLPELTGPFPATLSDGFLGSSSTSAPIQLRPPVPVEFRGHADRGGGVLLPSYDADVISEAHGPVDERTLPGGVNPQAALSRMRLFGAPLSSLLKEFDVPPSVLQLMENGLPRGVQMTWENQSLQSFGPFRAHAPSEAENPPDTTTLRLQVEATKDGHTSDARLSAFCLSLPTPETEVLNISFESLAFLEQNGRPPTLEVGRFEFTFAGALQLVQDLQKKASAFIGGDPPKVNVRPDGISGSYDIRIDEASAGAFLMRNIAVLIEVDIPFRAGLPTVRLGFASRESPFQLSVPPFGGGGFLQLVVDGSGIKELTASLEFGGMIGVDFGVVEAEVHALGGVRCMVAGSQVSIAGFLHLGGSVSIFGLVSISIELRVELAYDDKANQLAGRATLVIEVDLTLYADSVELDSGLWVFGGGSSPPPPPDLGSSTAQSGWNDYQGAYA